jgi:LPS export ABC transporter protein LptC
MLLNSCFFWKFLGGDKILSPLYIVTLLGLLSCEGDNKKLGKEHTGPVVTINNVVVKYSEQGKLKVFMKSPLSLTYINENKVFPDTINIDFYNPDGSIITHLRADSGRFDRNANEYTVMGNVKVNKLEENKVLTTTELKWSPATRKVFTEKALVVRDFRTSEITNAVGMDADQDFSHIVFRKATGIYKFMGP